MIAAAVIIATAGVLLLHWHGVIADEQHQREQQLDQREADLDRREALVARLEASAEIRRQMHHDRSQSC